MARKMSELVVKLTDQVSGPARKMAEALKAAERQTKAAAAAMKAGASTRFVSEMQRVGATGQQIDKVTRAWEKYRRESRLAADSTKWTKEQTAAVRAWERAHIQAVRNVNAAKRSAGGGGAAPAASQGRLAAAAGATAIAAPMRYVGPAVAAYATGKAVKDYANAERAITRIGITAEATDAQIAGVGTTAHGIAQEVAMPYANVVKGLDTLVATGRNLKDSMDFLPSVARTAAATGSEIEDIAKTAESVSSNFKIAGKDMQGAFDVLSAGGKAGRFEMPDMARYLPSLSPAAAAAGFTGEKGLTELVAMLQVVRKGSGTSEEAAGSMNNILQKMMSEETTKRFKKFGVDVPKAMDKARKEGRNLVEVFEELTNQALKGDLSKLPQLINDMEFARGVRALLTYKGEWQKMVGDIQRTAPGSVVGDLARVTNDAQSKLDRMGNTMTRTWQNLGRVLHDVSGGLAPLRALNALAEESYAIAERIKTQRPDQPKTPGEVALGVGANRVLYGVDTPEQRAEKLDRVARIDQRHAVVEKSAEMDAQIAAKLKRLEEVSGRANAPLRYRIEQEIARVRADKDALHDADGNLDDTLSRVEMNKRQRASLRTRMTETGDVVAVGENGVPLTGYMPTPVGKGMTNFGLGLHGTTIMPDAAAIPHAAPPARPSSLPQAAPMLKTFDDIYSTSVPSVVKPEVDSSALDAAKNKAAEAKQALEGLNGTATPQVNMASIDALLSKVAQIDSYMNRIGSRAGGVRAALSGASNGSVPNRGRSAAAQAIANLSRSRETSFEDRPFS